MDVTIIESGLNLALVNEARLCEFGPRKASDRSLPLYRLKIFSYAWRETGIFQAINFFSGSEALDDDEIICRGGANLDANPTL